MVQHNSHQEIIIYEDSNEHQPLLGLFKESRRVKLLRSQTVRVIPSIILGVTIWFGVTPSHELTPTAIHLLAVFSSCIFALLTTSANVSVIVLTGLVILSATQSFECTDKLTGLSIECRLCGSINPMTEKEYQCKAGKDAFRQSLEGFSSPVVWLIFAAFHLGKAVDTTQLGRRISLVMLQWFGKRTIGLAYAIVLSELFLAPFLPSNTARGGGIILPIVQSIANTLGSTPEYNPQIGAYLILVGSHVNLISSSIFLTGMACNPIVTAKANQLFDIDFDFMSWFKGGVVPGLFCALCLPLFIKWRIGFDEKDLDGYKASNHSNSIVDYAKKELKDVGSVSVKEWQLCSVLILCLSMWATASITHIDSTLAALIGIVVLLYMGTITWKDISGNTAAWDSLFWLGGFITIAQQLSQAGASAYIGHKISSGIQHFHLMPLPSLAIAYFFTTFMFSSLSAHTVAFVGTLLDAGHQLGANPMVLTAFTSYFGALGGCMTNYSSGSSVMYYSLGFVTRGKWFLVGIQLALFYVGVYFTLGLGWWKLLGWI